MARALASELFDSENNMVRIDMSEHMEKHSVSRANWCTTWLCCYDEGGKLTESIRRNPYSIVLFDEVEKAHRDVLNVLLQILDEGHVTDAQGRKVDFKNTIIIMTSNLASEHLLHCKKIDPSLRKLVFGELQREFKTRIFKIGLMKLFYFHLYRRNKLKRFWLDWWIRFVTDYWLKRISN